jgi:hypothetical protein
VPIVPEGEFPLEDGNIGNFKTKLSNS